MGFLETKVPPLLVAVGCGLLMWLLADGAAMQIDSLWRLFLVASCVMLGVVFAIAGVLSFLLAQTTVNPHTVDKASSLVDTGIYKITRNPMYLGFLFCLVAWGIQLHTLSSLAGVVIFIVYMNAFQIRPEERALMAQFGDAYQQYCSRVRRWL